VRCRTRTAVSGEHADLVGCAAAAEPGDQTPPPQQKRPSLRRPRHAVSADGGALVAIPGLHASTAQTILSEIGLDPREWPRAKAVCSWLGLAPRHDISGGKILRRSTLKTRTRAGQAFRLAAHAVSRRRNRLGAYE
jgi:transposase